MALAIPNAVEMAKTRSDRFFRENLKCTESDDLIVKRKKCIRIREERETGDTVQITTPPQPVDHTVWSWDCR